SSKGRTMYDRKSGRVEWIFQRLLLQQNFPERNALYTQAVSEQFYRSGWLTLISPVLKISSVPSSYRTRREHLSSIPTAMAGFFLSAVCTNIFSPIHSIFSL